MFPPATYDYPFRFDGDISGSVALTADGDDVTLVRQQQAVRPDRVPLASLDRLFENSETASMACEREVGGRSL